MFNVASKSDLTTGLNTDVQFFILKMTTLYFIQLIIIILCAEPTAYGLLTAECTVLYIKQPIIRPLLYASHLCRLQTRDYISKLICLVPPDLGPQSLYVFLMSFVLEKNNT